MISIFPLLYALIFLSTSANAGWSHIELGAGNYGGTGVLADGIRNLIKRSPKQFQALFNELNSLVTTKGVKGIFYVNDLNPEYAQYAAIKLALYAQSKRYEAVEIRVLPGDFTKIELPAVDSAHLRNPEPAFFRDLSPAVLQRLADLSDEGLYVTTHFDSKMQKIQKKDALETEKISDHAPPYIYPDGTPLDASIGFYDPNQLYRIKRKQHFNRELLKKRLGYAFSPGIGCQWILKESLF